MTVEINKCRDRKAPTFANINLLGACNARCYFCLGRDIENQLSVHNHKDVHFTKWPNFWGFLDECEEADIKKLYLTGQTMDGLQYNHINDLLNFLQDDRGFSVGVRTNGYLAEQSMDILPKFRDEIGYSIHSLNSEVNNTIMGRRHIPDWDYLLNNSGDNVRVSIVLNRHNVGELMSLFKYISGFPKVKYIQVRRISTETRLSELQLDIDLYETYFNWFKSQYPVQSDFYNAEVFNLFGKDILFWRTVETSVNSWNYFTDGTFSKEYFIVEGYLNEMSKLNAI